MTDAAGMGEFDDRAPLRREMDRIVQQRLIHLEARVEGLDAKIQTELNELEMRIKDRMTFVEDRLSNESAAKAVKLTFTHLGVNVDNAADLQRFRDDLRFSGLVRESMVKSFFALVAAICGVIGVSIAMFFKTKTGMP